MVGKKARQANTLANLTTSLNFLKGRNESENSVSFQILELQKSPLVCWCAAREGEDMKHEPHIMQRVDALHDADDRLLHSKIRRQGGEVYFSQRIRE